MLDTESVIIQHRSVEAMIVRDTGTRQRVATKNVAVVSLLCIKKTDMKTITTSTAKHLPLRTIVVYLPFRNIPPIPE